MGRVLQREGGCGRRELDSEGRERGTEGVWRVSRREGVREGITKAGREVWGRSEGEMEGGRWGGRV